MEDTAELREVLKNLITAAEQRDNTMGDPCRLLEVKAALSQAARAAAAVMAKVEGRG